ncbi:hypothetical protein WH47_05387 [Habropoda laboriosa]|uniref:Uncharacterized protein n=1 Tax=Habropoda laboriosa TaxID=597456 RepID=A0A0L7QJD7_9HYME|nr:hypothetical protein WH47_05387 [Habropoda laboriosa]
MYGVELWGFKERAEIDETQIRYIKWTLGLDIRIPGYLVLEESKREKLRVKAGIRVWKFEEGVRKDVGRKIVKECLKEKEANKEQTRTGKEREEYLKRNGLNQAGVDELRREERTIGLPEYLSKEGRGQKLIAQARCGNLENWNKYWEEEEGRRCDFCGDRFGNLEHSTRDCKETDRDIRMKDVVSGRQDRKIVEWLKKLKKKRKEERESG